MDGKETSTCNKKKKAYYRQRSAGSMIYGLGIVGAFVYYMMHTTSIIGGLIGTFKALFWPAFLIYKILVFFKM